MGERSFNIDAIERRTPVLDHETSERFLPDRMDKQWILLTEVIRRQILTEPETRKLVIQFADTPVSESLPGVFLDVLSSDPRIARLYQRYQESLGTYLKLESVPDEIIKPDIKSASALPVPEKTVEMLKDMLGADTPKFKERLDQYMSSGYFLQGITVQERYLIAQRYRFARDIKMLAFQAELLEQGDSLQKNQDGELRLLSGVVLRIDVEDEGKRKELMNPTVWEKRKQIKDRVYEIQVGSSQYFLKERKTARHTDTKKHEHKPGLTSLEEYQTARYFNEQATVHKDNVTVRWEKPIATVLFPDGFQFTVFEFEEGLRDADSARRVLEHEIERRREMYEVEFQLLQPMVEQMKDHPKVLSFESYSTESVYQSMLKWLRMKTGGKLEVTFQDFARIKAMWMERKARELMTETVIQHGYQNSDRDGYAYKVHAKEGEPLTLDIFGFDFEYFSRLDATDLDGRIESYRQYIKRFAGDAVGCMYWNDGTPVTRVQRAIYFAMMKADGQLQEDEMY